MWVLGAGTQIAMYKVWPYIFGANTLVPVMHGLVATIYILFTVAFGSISARMKSAQELIYHKNKAIQPGFRSNFIAKSLICNAG